VLNSCVSFRLDRMTGPFDRQPGMIFASVIPTLSKWCCECADDCDQDESRLLQCRSGCDGSSSADTFDREQCDRRGVTIVVSIQESASYTDEAGEVFSGSSGGQNRFSVAEDLTQTLLNRGISASGICRSSSGTGNPTQFFGSGGLGSGGGFSFPADINSGLVTQMAGDICRAIQLERGGIDDCPNPCNNSGVGSGCGSFTESGTGYEFVASLADFTYSSTGSVSESCEGLSMSWSVFAEGTYVFGSPQQSIAVQAQSVGSYSVQVIRDGGVPQNCPPSALRTGGTFTPWGYV